MLAIALLFAGGAGICWCGAVASPRYGRIGFAGDLFAVGAIILTLLAFVFTLAAASG